MRHDYSDGAVAGAVMGAMMIFIIIAAILGLLIIIAWWKVFAKAGKPGWAAIIPIYREIVMLEMAGKPIWWIVIFLLVPIVNIVFAIMLIDALVKTFGKTSGFTVGIIFLPFIFIPILGFGDAQYTKPPMVE